MKEDPHAGTEPSFPGRPTTVDVRKLDAAYIAAARWRCSASPNGAHHSVNSICRFCGVRR